MKRISKKVKIEFSIILAVAIQIALLINMPTANSYQISQTDDLIDDARVEKDFGERVLDAGLSFLVSFFSIKQIGTVSAQEINLQCCWQLGLNSHM